MEETMSIEHHFIAEVVLPTVDAHEELSRTPWFHFTLTHGRELCHQVGDSLLTRVCDVVPSPVDDDLQCHGLGCHLLGFKPLYSISTTWTSPLQVGYATEFALQSYGAPTPTLTVNTPVNPVLLFVEHSVSAFLRLPSSHPTMVMKAPPRPQSQSVKSIAAAVLIAPPLVPPLICNQFCWQPDPLYMV
ncbi:hypothetical protein M758_1G302300, partial [Ceratodon purpureus]